MNGPRIGKGGMDVTDFPQSSELQLDVTDFVDFYRNSFNLVVAFLLRLGASRSEAEDATQSAMVVLMSRWNEVREPAPWVRVVAKNKWLRAINSSMAAVPTGSASDIADAVTITTQPDDPARSHSLKVEHMTAVSIVAQLPQAQREAFALTFDGLCPAEIAAWTGKPVEVIRSNLAHARRRLRHKISSRSAKAC